MSGMEYARLPWTDNQSQRGLLFSKERYHQWALPYVRGFQGSILDDS